MNFLLEVFLIEVWCLLIGLMAAIIYSFLYQGKCESEGYSPQSGERIDGQLKTLFWIRAPINMQSGIITILVAIYLVVQVVQDSTQFPDIPPSLLALLGLNGITQVGTLFFSFGSKPKPRI